MTYSYAAQWDIQDNYTIEARNLYCRRAEFDSCTYRAPEDCAHRLDVFFTSVIGNYRALAIAGSAKETFAGSLRYPEHYLSLT